MQKRIKAVAKCKSNSSLGDIYLLFSLNLLQVLQRLLCLCALVQCTHGLRRKKKSQHKDVNINKLTKKDIKKCFVLFFLSPVFLKCVTLISVWCSPPVVLKSPGEKHLT